MKNISILSFVVIFLISFSSSIGELYGNSVPVINKDINFYTIDNKDSVFIDVQNAVFSGVFIDIPVFIISDDIINALDFAIIFNIEELKYEKIIDHTGHIQYTDFYNVNDNTLRFTSNSLATYNTNIAIISIRFRLVANCLNSTDIYRLEGFLNGDLCSPKNPNAIVCRSSSTTDSDEMSYLLFPTPASTILNIFSTAEGSISILDTKGSRILGSVQVSSNQQTEIPITIIPNGLYVAELKFGSHIYRQWIIIQK